MDTGAPGRVAEAGVDAGVDAGVPGRITVVGASAEGARAGPDGKVTSGGMP